MPGEAMPFTRFVSSVDEVNDHFVVEVDFLALSTQKGLSLFRPSIMASAPSGGSFRILQL
jgi:hypothetical protein